MIKTFYTPNFNNLFFGNGSNYAQRVIFAQKDIFALRVIFERE